MSSKTTLQIFEDTTLTHARYFLHRINIPNVFYRRKSISGGFGSGIKLDVNPWIPNFLAVRLGASHLASEVSFHNCKEGIIIATHRVIEK